jgi:CheY-like chemotaxis protein
VLLVDDEADILRAMQAAQDAQLSALFAESGAEAVALAGSGGRSWCCSM